MRPIIERYSWEKDARQKEIRNDLRRWLEGGSSPGDYFVGRLQTLKPVKRTWAYTVQYLVNFHQSLNVPHGIGSSPHSRLRSGSTRVCFRMSEASFISCLFKFIRDVLTWGMIMIIISSWFKCLVECKEQAPDPLQHLTTFILNLMKKSGNPSCATLGASDRHRSDQCGTAHFPGAPIFAVLGDSRLGF